MRSNILTAAFLIILSSQLVFAADEKKINATEIIDPFEADEDLRFAADTFCRDYTLANPLAQKIVLPYKKNCHFWWQCTTYELQKMECQGLAHRINLHYDLYLDRCEMPSSNIKCKYQFDEEEIIMEAIMEYYKKPEEGNKKQ